MSSWNPFWSDAEIQEALENMEKDTHWYQIQGRITEIAKEKIMPRDPRVAVSQFSDDEIYTQKRELYKRWLLSQDLKDGLPRSEQEVQAIEAEQNYGKQKRKGHQ